MHSLLAQRSVLLGQNCDFDEWHQITTDIALGDTQMFERYYLEFSRFMFVEAKRLSGFDEHRCLDVVHDAMLKAIRCMKPMSSYSHVKAWSRAVVQSVVYNHYRRESLATQRAVSYRINNSCVGVENDSTQQAIDIKLENQARLVWIEEQIRSLSPELQQLFELRYRLGWTLERIARRLGVKTGAVDGRLRRAIQIIQAKAEIEYGE